MKFHFVQRTQTSSYIALVKIMGETLCLLSLLSLKQ